MMRVLFSVFVMCFVLFVQPVLAEGGQVSSPLVQIRLLADRDVVAAGGNVWIGIEEIIAPHWHTYWVNPGDSGLALRVKWSLPEGADMGALEWPLPQRIEYEPLLNYGYEGHVTLLQKLRIPHGMPEGVVTLKADIEVLVCKEECIPETGTYELNLNISNELADNGQNKLKEHVARLPHKTVWDVSFDEAGEGDGQSFVLSFPLRGFSTEEQDTLRDVSSSGFEFFPLDWGLVQNPALPELSYEDGALILKQARGERSLDELNSMDGLLVVEKDGQRTGFLFEAQKSTVLLSGPITGKNLALELDEGLAGGSITLLSALVFAVLGGLILNLMPCVFPVLSLKALSLVKISQKHPELARAHGISYTLGVVLSFLAIAGLLMGLKAAGSEIGWGFQLQDPLVVGVLSYLLFVLGLNLSGFFDFSNPFGNLGGGLANKDGVLGSFFTGVLATLVATPCTAPFMAGALGFALVQPMALGLLVFAALGLGLALPYLVLAFVPALHRALPKPGAWMEVFRQALAFPMFAAALWLLWVLGLQTGLSGLVMLLVGMVLITFALWVFQHRPRRFFWRGVVLGLGVLSLALAFCSLPRQVPASVEGAAVFGEGFSEERLGVLLTGDEPVFVEMTAAWCITCKLNHAVAINIKATRALFERYDVAYLIGDWTNADFVITKYLARYGRNGVPLYVYYGPRDQVTGKRPAAQILPQVLTGSLIDGILTEKEN